MMEVMVAALRAKLPVLRARSMPGDVLGEGGARPPPPAYEVLRGPRVVGSDSVENRWCSRWPSGGCCICLPCVPLVLLVPLAFAEMVV